MNPNFEFKGNFGICNFCKMANEVPNWYYSVIKLIRLRITQEKDKINMKDPSSILVFTIWLFLKNIMEKGLFFFKYL